jgi:MFS transporter, DHA2 family, glioxin efflux transporter
MGASSNDLPRIDSEDRIEDEKKAEESDANTMVERNDHEEVEDEPERVTEPQVAEEDQLGEDEYPKGLQFVFILISLVLSIFMVALDLVITCSGLLSIDVC